MTFGELYTDATPLSIGYLLKLPTGDKEFSEKFKKKVGVNEAEYMALIAGMTEAWKNGVKNLAIYTDSQLALQQIRGKYRVKAENLKPLCEQAKALTLVFENCAIAHIQGPLNPADRISREVLSGSDYEILRKPRRKRHTK